MIKKIYKLSRFNINHQQKTVNIKKRKKLFLTLLEKIRKIWGIIIKNINTYYLSEIKKSHLKYEKILEYLDELIENKYQSTKIQEIIKNIFNGVS